MPASTPTSSPDETMAPYRSTRLLALLLFLLAIVSLTAACQEVATFIDNISDGAPCSADAVCWGQRCLTPEQGYPGGYCTTLDCETQGCSGLYSECFRTQIEGQDVTACFELCDFDGACDRASEGYTCVQMQDTAVCMPPGATNAPAQGAIGSSCSNNLQCNGEGAVCLSSFFGGYCSRMPCDGSASCDGNACVPLNPAGESDADKRFACLESCQSDDDCRFGYACQEYEGAMVCLEGDPEAPRNPDGADDGAPCVAQINCKGGTCIREGEEADGSVSFPGGYCTTRDCDDDADCNGEAICVARARATTCLATCASDADCRDGYACKRTESEVGVCDSIVEATPPDPSGESAFDIACGSSKTLDFTLPAGAIGFYIAPFLKGSGTLIPTTLRTPGGTIDIPNDYSFLAINHEILGNLAPLLFPASDAAGFRDAFGPGEYSLTVDTDASEVCYYVIPKTSVGTELDINLYFVGIPGMTATSAASDADVAQVVDVVEAIYERMGVSARVANYFEASPEVAERYTMIRDFNDVYNLVATSEPPGDTAAENLSVNVFLIQDFNIAEAPGLLGVSTGIPGVAGLHGNSGSGLVFSAATLGSDNGQLGQTMAHEIGHFLGLRHTTEHYASEYDPITDTPECGSLQFNFLPELCPDIDNFMFAFATGRTQRDVSAGQKFVVQRSALVK